MSHPAASRRAGAGSARRPTTIIAAISAGVPRPVAGLEVREGAAKLGTAPRKAGTLTPRPAGLPRATRSSPGPGEDRDTLLRGPLVDGINAVPLSLATRGGGKVEADMLLLTQGADGHGLRHGFAADSAE